MRFEFATATRIIFGSGTINEAGLLAAAEGGRALLVTGGSPHRSRSLVDALNRERVEHVMYAVIGEPTVDTVLQGCERARRADCDIVIGFGGGSALDAGKAIAALLTNPGDPLDYLEIVGKGQKLTNPSAPYLAIPTTAGTGVEVTRNSVLRVPEHRVKVSLRSPFMLPRLALIDPELTYTLPPDVTAFTGMDALTQVLEPYVSCRANPMTDGLCREGLGRAARSLRMACAHGDAQTAREDMATTSLFGGLALANAGLGAVHGIAGPFGGMFAAPHGAVCARLLPPVMAANIAALRSRSPASQALERYAEISVILTNDQDASAEDGVAWVQKLCDEFEIPPLGSYGFDADDVPVLIQKACAASSMKGNPVELNSEEIRKILEQAM